MIDRPFYRCPGPGLDPSLHCPGGPHGPYSTVPAGPTPQSRRAPLHSLGGPPLYNQCGQSFASTSGFSACLTASQRLPQARQLTTCAWQSLRPSKRGAGGGRLPAVQPRHGEEETAVITDTCNNGVVCARRRSVGGAERWQFRAFYSV